MSGLFLCAREVREKGPFPTAWATVLSKAWTPPRAAPYFTMSEKLFTCAPVPPVQISKPISME